jgi:hypothetical protein
MMIKAKKDYNYVRFFEILRNPSTPYLFACIMFKHVELMRKVAFRIMSKTYGARRKENGENIYDAYPLKKLAQILCFEDMDEARDACRHYNITVKEMKVKSSSSPGHSSIAEIVFWRASEFKEAKDPEKGTVLPLRPKKMLKYIESKLMGATRLGVCRGEVSGEGASLAQPMSAVIPSVQAAPAQFAAGPAAQTQTADDDDVADEAERTNLLIKRQQELFTKEQEASRKAEEDMLKEQKEREEAEKIREQERKKQQKLEEERRKKEEERKRREREAQVERERAEKAAEEEQRRKEEERQRQLQLQAEAARRKAEEEERERQRQEAIRKEEERKRQIHAEQERRRKEEAERRRQEQERQRQEALRIQEEERKRQEALALKRAQELQLRVDNARKLLLIRRWRQELPRQYQSRKSTAESLNRIDPTFSLSSPFKENFIAKRLVEVSRNAEEEHPVHIDTRRILNRILANTSSPFDVASLMLDAVMDDNQLKEHSKPRGLMTSGSDAQCNTTTFLFRIAVILPEPDTLEEKSMYELIHTWLNRRLEYGRVDTMKRQCPMEKHTYAVRVLFSKSDSWNGPPSCDAALIVVPPEFCNDDQSNPRKLDAILSAFSCVDEDTPRVAYILGDGSDPSYFERANQLLASCLPSCTDEFPVVFPSAVEEKSLEGSLKLSIRSLTDMLRQTFPPVVEQVSTMKLAARCICDVLWKDSGIGSLDGARSALEALEKEIDIIGQSVEETWSAWPADEFAGEGGLVRDYFGTGLHLPTSWTSSVFRDTAKSKVKSLLQILRRNVPYAVNKLISGASASIQEECEDMLEQRHYRKCIQRALQCSGSHDEIFYLPKGTAEAIATNALQTMLGANGIQNGLYPQLNNEDQDNEIDEEVSAVNTATALNVNEWEREAKTDAAVFKKAQDIFEISRTISPVPPPTRDNGMMTPPPGAVTLPPGTVSPPPGVMSNKRNWMGMTSDDFPSQQDDPPAGRGSRTNKRLKEAAYSPRSRDITESSAFTRKLEAMLSGETTVDMEVGSTTLVRLIGEAPLLDNNPSDH